MLERPVWTESGQTGRIPGQTLDKSWTNVGQNRKYLDKMHHAAVCSGIVIGV